MSTSLQQLHDRLRQHDHSLTQTRDLVFLELQQHGPVSMNQLIKKLDPKVNRASVYRTILLFEQLDIVQRIQLGWKYKLELSGDFSYHHHHIICTKCNKIINIDEDDFIEARLQQIAQANNFVIQDHQLEISGLCADCHRPN